MTEQAERLLRGLGLELVPGTFAPQRAASSGEVAGIARIGDVQRGPIPLPAARKPGTEARDGVPQSRIEAAPESREKVTPTRARGAFRTNTRAREGRSSESSEIRARKLAPTGTDPPGDDPAEPYKT